MANDLTGQNIQNTYQRVLHVGDDGFMYDGTGSLYTPVSASHEITTETSSSHAISADTLGGLDTTVAELNHLDGITATNGNFVKTMDQSVAIGSIPTLANLNLTTLREVGVIALPQGANVDALHLQVKDAAGASPGVFLGDNNEDIISFVDQDSSTVATIDQSGGYNGTINGGTW